MKKNLLSSLFLALSFCSSEAGKLLQINSSGIHFDENLKKFSDERIKELMKTKREHEEFEEFTENIKERNNIDTFIQKVGRCQKNNKELEEIKTNGEEKAQQYFIWQIISNFHKYDIFLLENSEIFNTASVNTLPEIFKDEGKYNSFKDFQKSYEDLKDENQAFFDLMKEEKENFNQNLSLSSMVALFNKKKEILLDDDKKSDYDKKSIWNSLSITQESILCSLNFIMRRILQSKMGCFSLEIGTIVFQETMIKYMEDNQNAPEDFLKLSDILDIMMYVCHKISQFDLYIDISFQDEENIKEKLERKFVFYRRAKLEGKETQFLEIEENNCKLYESAFIEKYNSSQENSFIQDITKEINCISCDKNILPPLKNMVKNVIFNLLNEFLNENNIDENFKNYFLKIINCISVKAVLFSIRYGTAFHEAAHAFIALYYNVKVQLATCAQEGNARGFILISNTLNTHICESYIHDIEKNIKISCAGILGDFFISKKLEKEEAASDFRKILFISKNVLLPIWRMKEFFKNINKENLEKMEKLMEEGLKMLKNHPVLGQYSLDKFLTFPSPEENDENNENKTLIIKNQDERKKIENLIAACIVETFEILKDSKNIDGFQILAEEIFDQHVITEEKIKKYATETSKEDFLKNKRSNDENSSDDVEIENFYKKKALTLMFFHHKNHCSFHDVITEDINKETKEIKDF